MAFKKLVASRYPPRHWSIVGHPETGKSTFASQMRDPLLVIDADQRFAEQVTEVGGDVYYLSEDPRDHSESSRIATALDDNMAGGAVRTIVVDSLTAILQPLITKAIQDKDAERVKSLSAAFKGKAMAVRRLQDAVTKWGTDTLWVYHLHHGRDSSGKEQVLESIPTTEMARLIRSLNMQLVAVKQGGKYGIQVKWARSGHSGMTIWDDRGRFKGMPELIEAAVYNGLDEVARRRIANADPDVFPSPAVAIAWGMERGVFKDEAHAKRAYELLKKERPKNAYAMAFLWKADVYARVERAKEKETNGEGHLGQDD